MAEKMTAKWVERVREVEMVRREYYDAEVAGLGLRVSRSGKKVWFLKSRSRGESTSWRLTLGPYPSYTLADAREAARAELHKAGRGENPAKAKQEQKTTITIERLAADYIEQYAKINKRSWLKDEQALKRNVLPSWGQRKACDIKKADVHTLLMNQIQNGNPVMANRLLALIRKVFNWALSLDLVESNPCHLMKPPAPETPREKVLSESELKALWAALEAYGGSIELMFKLMILTGQRGGEVARMRWEHLDLKGGWWTIPAADSKNKLSHRVPLTEVVCALLKRRQAQGTDGDGGWVIQGRRAGAQLKHIGLPTKTLREASQVSFNPHDLRHTTATGLGRLKVPRLVVSKLLNHKEAGITRIYDQHTYDDEKREALELWSRYVEDNIAKKATVDA